MPILNVASNLISLTKFAIYFQYMLSKCKKYKTLTQFYNCLILNSVLLFFARFRSDELENFGLLSPNPLIVNRFISIPLAIKNSWTDLHRDSDNIRFTLSSPKSSVCPWISIWIVGLLIKYRAKPSNVIWDFLVNSKELGSNNKKGSYLEISIDENTATIEVDRYSSIPIYYIIFKDCLYASTKIDSLINSAPSDFKLEISSLGISTFIKTNTLMDNLTFFNNIKKIP